MISCLRSWAVRHVPLLGIGLLLLSLLHLVVRTSGALFETAQFKAEVEALTSEVLAEELASWLISQQAEEPWPEMTLQRAGFNLSVNRSSVQGDDQMTIRVTSPAGRAFSYTTMILEGAAPFPLGRPLSISRSALAGSSRTWDWTWKMPIPEPIWLPVGDFPEVLPEANTKQGLNPELIGMRLDHRIALLYLGSGTDLDDYLLDGGREAVVETALRKSSWVAIDGNLWIVNEKAQVWIELSNDLTIIVHGNIYLGSSLQVLGPGRLTLVALGSPSSSYRDLDLDGRFSVGDEILASGATSYHGWIEGGGGVYLGLPGRTEPLPEILIGGSVVAEGEVYLRAGRAVISGALVLGSGFTRESERCELRLPGSLLPQTNRVRVPGFVVTGDPRAAQLQLKK